MGRSPIRPSIREAIFGMYVSNIYCATKGLAPFMSENNKEKRKKRLDDFNCSIRKILVNKKFIIGVCDPVSLDEKEKRLQHLCDEIIDILLSRRKDLKEMKIKGDSDYLLFLEKTFDFFLSEKNLPNFVNLIFNMVSGGTIFSKAEDDEKARKWLDSFEFKV